MPQSQSSGFCHFFKKQTSHFFAGFFGQFWGFWQVFSAQWDHFFFPVMQQKHGTAVPTPAGSSQARSSRKIGTRGPDKTSTSYLSPEVLCKLLSSWCFVSGRLSQAGLLYHLLIFSTTRAATNLGERFLLHLVFFVSGESTGFSSFISRGYCCYLDCCCFVF